MIEVKEHCKERVAHRVHGMGGGEAEVTAGRGIDLRGAVGHPDLGLDVFGPRQAEDVLQEIPPDEAPTNHVGHVPRETIIAAPKEQRQGQQVELLLRKKGPEKEVPVQQLRAKPLLQIAHNLGTFLHSFVLSPTAPFDIRIQMKPRDGQRNAGGKELPRLQQQRVGSWRDKDFTVHSKCIKWRRHGLFFLPIFSACVTCLTHLFQVHQIFLGATLHRKCVSHPSADF
mmetsp:Transcript_17922/g.29475  ORF Transcript_17922/g.29475 Transcript_17922/m.29475 type:complete len:227 (+) Transcript_17922:682-1362(+)